MTDKGGGGGARLRIEPNHAIHGSSKELILRKVEQGNRD